MRGYTLVKDDYLLRLRKIEGQVRGLQRLVEEDTCCIDILTQIASVNAASQPRPRPRRPAPPPLRHRGPRRQSRGR